MDAFDEDLILPSTFPFFLQLKDLSKAVRVAIQFAMDEMTQQKVIYTEKICNTCGAKSKKSLKVELYPTQKAFLEQAAKEYGLPSADVSCYS